MNELRTKKKEELISMRWLRACWLVFMHCRAEDVLTHVFIPILAVAPQAAKKKVDFDIDLKWEKVSGD